MHISYTKKLGQLLVEQKLLTEEQLQAALDWQRQRPGQKIGEILLQQGYISETDLLNILQQKLNIPQAYIPPQIPADVLELVSESNMRRLKALPLAREGQQLLVAMVDPLDMLAIDQLRQITNLSIKPLLATPGQLEAAITQHMGKWQLEKGKVREKGEQGISPIISLVDGFLAQAVADQASDIHIEPQPDKVLVRLRVDGLLRSILTLPIERRDELVSRIKILAQLDIAEKRQPQDGRFMYTVGQETIDLRVSTIPTINGEKVVLRLLRQSKAQLNIHQLGFSAANMARFIKLIDSTSGMVLITGPTGCGKTTTLYAILNRLNDPTKNIVTLEDPVEYSITGINQIQIQAPIGLTFGVGLRSVLRQDPDIIMVGEIRDRETAEIAVRAANTGHLVLSTLHTNSAADAITRLLDMGVERYLVAGSIIGVVAQRLVRKLCPACRQAYQPSPEELLFFSGAFKNDGLLYKSKGCHACAYTGYQGRIGLHEVLLINSSLRELINQRASAEQIKKAALKEGMIPLVADGMDKVQAGITTLQEIRRVTYSAVD